MTPPHSPSPSLPDVKLLHALVNIAAALKLSAIKHPLESRDINELYDKVDASLRECMNSTSMDVPLNVMKILRDNDKDGDEAIIVRQALAFVNGPLELCIAHDLTGLLGTAQISTHGTYDMERTAWNALQGSFSTDRIVWSRVYLLIYS
jgi:hypothetical protein